MHVKDKIPEARKLMKEIVKENIKLTKNCKLGIREYMLYHFFSYFPNLYIICGKLNIKIRKYKTELLNIKTKK